MPSADFTELRSPRLILRRFRPDDAAELCAYRDLPEVACYQSWEAFGPADAALLIAGQMGLNPNAPGTWLQLAMIVAESGALIGDIGLHFRADESRQVEIGITLSPAFQHRGYATEAVNCVLSYLFDTLGKHRVMAVTDTENRAAVALLRRAGFRQEGHFVEHVWYKGGWGSEYWFALLDREWRARSGGQS